MLRSRRVADGIIERFDLNRVFQQKLQVDDFARCVLENKESIIGGTEGWKDMLIIDTIYNAITSGRKEKIG